MKYVLCIFRWFCFHVLHERLSLSPPLLHRCKCKCVFYNLSFHQIINIPFAMTCMDPDICNADECVGSALEFFFFCLMFFIFHCDTFGWFWSLSLIWYNYSSTKNESSKTKNKKKRKKNELLWDHTSHTHITIPLQLRINLKQKCAYFIIPANRSTFRGQTNVCVCASSETYWNTTPISNTTNDLTNSHIKYERWLYFFFRPSLAVCWCYNGTK